MSIRYKKLHLGCGSITPEGWLNLDGSWNAWLTKHPKMLKIAKILGIIPKELHDIKWNTNIFIHDVRKRFPFPDNCFSAIYASHLLEHLYLEEAKFLLKECKRLLEPKGVLRMVVPDLQPMVLEYIGEKTILSDNKEIRFKADWLNERLLLRGPKPPSGSIIYRLYTSLTDFHSHKWMYDAESLIGYFEWAGFEEVQEMQLFQSRIEGIDKIESPERILKGEGICIEGVNS